MATRPNVLMIHSDQHRYDCLGLSGHLLVKTPVLDALAAQGMQFTHAFCPIPLCMPVRNSMHFGVWPSTHLAIANWGTEAPRDAIDGLASYSEALAEAGYFLGYVGKWHVHAQRSPLDYGFDAYVPSEAYEPWRASIGVPALREGWFGGCDDDASVAQTRLGWGADHTIRMLQHSQQHDSPFFIRWDPSEPHLPNIVPEPYCSMYAPADIPPWPGFADPLIGKPYIQSQQQRSWRVDGWSWPDWAPVVSRYLGEITLLDAQIGRILGTLDRLGLADNTVVIYTTDHGDMCGSHGMIDKHYILYDDVWRVPLIIRWPGRITAGSRSDAWVIHSLDLAATFCEVAGAAIPTTFQGHSLVPLFDSSGTPVDNGRSDVFATYYGNQFGLYSQRAVRDRRWKYVWNATAEDELYDLQTDPGELYNCAVDPACRPELARLRTRLVSWMRATGDPLLNEWTTLQLLEGRKV